MKYKYVYPNWVACLCDGHSDTRVWHAERRTLEVQWEIMIGRVVVVVRWVAREQQSAQHYDPPLCTHYASRWLVLMLMMMATAR